MSKLWDFIKNKREIITIIILSLVVVWITLSYVDTLNIFNENNTNEIIISVFGTLFGLLLTSYAILFGLIPALSIDSLETNAIKSVNFRFFLGLIINLLIIICSFIIIFSNGMLLNILIFIQIFLISFLIQLFFLLILYLFLLFKATRNNVLKQKTKKNI